jgi:hypothetical protein
VDGFFNVVVSFVNVQERAFLQALGESVVFLFAYVVMRFVQQLQCAVQSAAPRHVRVNRRMIVEILAVVDGSFLNLVDGFVDFVNGFLFLFTKFAAVWPLQMRACVT